MFKISFGGVLLFVLVVSLVLALTAAASLFQPPLGASARVPASRDDITGLSSPGGASATVTSTVTATPIATSTTTATSCGYGHTTFMSPGMEPGGQS